MSWLQENGASMFFMLLFVLFVFRGQIMARIFGVGQITVHDLSKKLATKSPPLLVDVRTPPEYNQVHIKGSLLVPLGEVGSRLADLRKHHGDREIAVICRTGNRSINGAVSFKRAGFEVVHNVVGGLIHWEGQGYQVIK
ncbi:MAG: rhodanese-like domain-containing protein [Magnetococcales bacterium]|nr:rhodanese-like domain-containing protein [Magnetococcales bacterium]